jgi:hypothetical protein
MLRLDVCWFFAAALFSYVSSDDDHVLQTCFLLEPLGVYRGHERPAWRVRCYYVMLIYDWDKENIDFIVEHCYGKRILSLES